MTDHPQFNQFNSVLWHCWLGHQICKRSFPKWLLLCRVERKISSSTDSNVMSWQCHSLHLCSSCCLVMFCCNYYCLFHLFQYYSCVCANVVDVTCERGMVYRLAAMISALLLN